MPIITVTQNTLTLLNEKSLTDAFIKKHELKLASDCTKLPAPLGFFPLRAELLEEMSKEHFYITTDQDGIVKISDQTGISTRKFNSRSYPQLWAWPTISVDPKGKSVTCTLTFRVNDKETFPMTVSDRLAKAVVAVHPDCHPFIQEIARTGSAGESWNEVGLGPIMSLAEVFGEFAREKPMRWKVAREKLDIFTPDPLELNFVQTNSAHRWDLHRRWLAQLKEWVRQLGIPIREE